MKKILTIGIEELIWRHTKRQSNVSRYVETLIKQDMQMAAQEPIYEAMTQKMLRDEVFISELKNKFTGNVAKVNDVDITLTNDWGA